MSDDVTMEAGWTPPDGYELQAWRRGFARQIGPLYRRGGVRPTLGLQVQEQHVNGLGNLHGGMLMTLADVAWGNVVSVERSAFWVTIRLTCDFLSAARLGEWVEAGGELLGEQDDVFTVRGRVWAGGRTLATGLGLFKAVSPRDPRPGEKAFAPAEAAA